MTVARPPAWPAATEETFNRARRRAFIHSMLADLSGRSDDLLSFEDVRKQLRLREPSPEVRLKEISLDRIVGSVGRYRDFNRAFLPRGQIDPARWMRIAQLHRQSSLPPIDVFQVGDVYFVRDGNHRVSVARARHHKTIRARVVEIPVRVALGPGISAEELILKSGYSEFLERTSLDRTIPEQCIELTRAGGYESLLQHIEVHQFYAGLRSRRYPSLHEAAADWYRNVYLPIVSDIRASKILSQFPGRTEADLYLWIAENRVQLMMHYGARAKAQEAVDSFAHQHGQPRLLRLTRTLLQRIYPRRLGRAAERRPASVKRSR